MDQPHKITPKILEFIEEISKNLGRILGSGFIKIAPELRRKNKIRTIHSTLAIEGNTLSKEQVTDIIENKVVYGPQKDIIEVKNAIEIYNQLSELNPFSEVSFKKAHKILMKDILKSDAGKYRRQGVGVGEHLAPPYKLVSTHMKTLFDSLKESKESMLIKSCIFHYEHEFIHPFIDGNGRMGRLWQTLLLCQVDPIFESIPIENFVKDKQTQYYEILRKCDLTGDSTLFIEFMLNIINKGLNEFIGNKTKPLTAKDRLQIAKNNFQENEFDRKEYLKLFLNISSATGTRDLRFGVENNILKRIGYDRNSKYLFI